MKTTLLPFQLWCLGEQMAVLENRKKVSSVLVKCCLVQWMTNNLLLTGQWDIIDFLFNDDDNFDLPKGSGVRKRVADMMMEVETDFKKKKITENDAQYTFKAPFCCFENALTDDLLLFGQSI